MYHERSPCLPEQDESRHSIQEGISSMGTVPRLFERIPAIRAIVSDSSRQQSWLVRLFGKISSAPTWQQTTSPSKLRIRVLRRDRYRCRGCDRKRDEITLCVYRINSHVLDADGCLALCSDCEVVAKSLAVEAESIPDLLRVLWLRLHESRNNPALLPLSAPHIQSPESQTALTASRLP